MPRKATQDNISGEVKVSLLIKDGVVKEVKFLSGNKVFYETIRTAVRQYKCATDAGSEAIEATQIFYFKPE